MRQSASQPPTLLLSYINTSTQALITDVPVQVHFHMIPKPNEKEGLEIGWPATKTDMEGLKALHADLKAKM